MMDFEDGSKQQLNYKKKRKWRNTQQQRPSKSFKAGMYTASFGNILVVVHNIALSALMLHAKGSTMISHKNVPNASQ